MWWAIPVSILAILFWVVLPLGLEWRAEKKIRKGFENNKKIIYIPKGETIMKSGEFIEARTHADFLNQAFGTNYKGWMKSSWKYCDGWVVWMTHFNTIIDGWKNTFISDADHKDPCAIIKQENLDGKDTFNGIPIEISNSKKRIVFDIVEIKINGKYKRKYVFRGKYVYDETKSDPRTVQYLNKISDEF